MPVDEDDFFALSKSAAVYFRECDDKVDQRPNTEAACSKQLQDAQSDLAAHEPVYTESAKQEIADPGKDVLIHTGHLRAVRRGLLRLLILRLGWLLVCLLLVLLLLILLRLRLRCRSCSRCVCASDVHGIAIFDDADLVANLRIRIIHRGDRRFHHLLIAHLNINVSSFDSDDLSQCVLLLF